MLQQFSAQAMLISTVAMLQDKPPVAAQGGEQADRRQHLPAATGHPERHHMVNAPTAAVPATDGQSSSQVERDACHSPVVSASILFSGISEC